MRVSSELVHRFAHRDGILTIRLFISAIFHQSAGDSTCSDGQRSKLFGLSCEAV